MESASIVGSFKTPSKCSHDRIFSVTSLTKTSFSESVFCWESGFCELGFCSNSDRTAKDSTARLPSREEISTSPDASRNSRYRDQLVLLVIRCLSLTGKGFDAIALPSRVLRVKTSLLISLAASVSSRALVLVLVL